MQHYRINEWLVSYRFNDPTVCMNGNVPVHYSNNHSHSHNHSAEGRSPGVARAATLPRNAFLPSTGSQLISQHNSDEGTTSFNSPARHMNLSVSCCLFLIT